ncbi:MAG: peptidoglycan-binding domain-containing protein [Minisyncoccia bacterium]
MKLKNILRVGVLLGLVLPLVVSAAFDDVVISSGGTLSVTVGGNTIDLTVTNGKVETLVVNAADMDITLASGSTINLTSADKKNFTYRGDKTVFSLECGSSSSVLSVSLPSGSSETVNVAPGSSTCTTTSGGGGSSSSSSSSSSTTSTLSSTSSASPTTTTTTTTSTTATPKTTTTTTATTVGPATPAVTAPVVAPVVSAPVSVSMAPVLTKEINPGARNDEVMKLQELLSQDPTIYPEGTVSGFYGPKTTAAVKKFQAKYGLPAVGRVGPATLAKLNDVFGSKAEVISTPAPSTSVQARTANQIQSQIQAIQQQIQSITSGSAAQVAPVVSGSVSIDSELNPGARNDEVMDLQKLLAQDPTIYPEGTVSGFYGPKTTAAVKKFQAKYGLPAVGRVGPATLQKINEILGSSSVSAPIAPPTPSYVAPAAPSSAAPSQAQQIADQIKAIQAQIDAILKK